MKSRRSFFASQHGRAIAAALVVIAAGATAAADGGSARGGGLVPAPRKTREELIREWDLNSDGKIDQGEAEAAASRMRRERAELRLNSGIDPVTGLPRGEEDARAAEDERTAEEEADAEMLREEEEAAAADVRRESGERPPALPGTRAPRPRPRSPEKPVENRDLNAGRKPVIPPEIQRARRPLTGGTRAGGVPARAGYGSGVPSRPLNAGLPIVPQTRGVMPAAPRVDLVPPGRPGTTGTRPVAPVPPRPAASREVYNPY